MTKFLKEQPQQLEIYDDLLVGRLVEQITIRGWQLTTGLSRGLRMKVKYNKVVSRKRFIVLFAVFYFD